MDTQKSFSTLVQNYFCQCLINQRHVSNRTVESYRDTFRLLFKFIIEQEGKSASQLRLSDINADLILKFLDYLEAKRHNTIRSRNIRLAAIRSFLQYVSYQEPEALPNIQKALAIPMKRYDRPLVGFFTREEMDAILGSIDTQTWSGQRDQALFTTLYNTGARISEIITVKRSDIDLTQNIVIHLHGKGRKERSVPLWKSTTTLIRKWLNQIDSNPQTPLFPNRSGEMMSRSGVDNRIKTIAKKAEEKCPSLKKKQVSSHIIRHTTAMHLLQSGIDITVIALWLGHESISTTHKYMEADLEMKKRVLNAIQEPKHKGKRKPLSNDLITFLEKL